jgi:DNA-binding LytR/AlgR family response regulator
MLNCVALDDEPLSLELLIEYTRRIPMLRLAHTFTRPSLARQFLAHNPCDLLFLDIQMPDISGIDFYKNNDHKCMVIFITAFAEYAVEGFALSAIDYLLKPYTFERFKQAIDKAAEYQTYVRSKTVTEYLFVYSEYNLLKIDIADILYIEGLDDYIKIHLPNRNPIINILHF